MNLRPYHLFVVAVLANIVGGLTLIAIMAIHHKRTSGRWSLGDGY